MAAAEVLATGSTGADSGDIAIASGSSLTVGLKGVTADAKVLIKLKDDTGGYNVVDTLTANSAVKLIVAPGTYRFTRVAGASCGVYSA